MSLESTLYVHLVENSLIVHLRISPPPPEESSSQSSERPTSKPNRAWESRTFDIFKIIFFFILLEENNWPNLFSGAYWQGSKICLKRKAVLQILTLCSHAFTGANGWSVDGYQDSPRGRKWRKILSKLGKLSFLEYRLKLCFSYVFSSHHHDDHYPTFCLVMVAACRALTEPTRTRAFHLRQCGFHHRHWSHLKLNNVTK